MSDDNQRLEGLLKSWKAMEPAPAFEDRVWRNIRRLPARQNTTLGLWDFLSGWSAFRPAYLSAAAALIGIFTGLAGALSVPSRGGPLHANLFKSLPERSLSASYIHFVGGERP